MWVDPIVEEVRKNREEFAAQFNFDLRAMGKALQEMERASGRQVVSFAPITYHDPHGQEEDKPFSIAPK
ncbi:hypothetical protein [Candidatus Magnetaquicoccus inordinatus]|uniref:hypothetical protein n=1 Tax=Candidatus Magnetaquicoccus inordinatus TaxID=2496818 RepID=UPI00102B0C7F|nr:hypothetical protein [Candidatus Magnetaquicoccus inordinatus]